MKPSFFQLLATGLTGLLLAGCGESHSTADHSGHEHGEKAAHTENHATASFDPKHGLKIPGEMAKFLNLQVVDVTERKASSALRFSAQVYRAASELLPVSTGSKATALASAWIATSDLEQLTTGQQVLLSLEYKTSLAGWIKPINPIRQNSNGMTELLLEVADPERRLEIAQHLAAVVPLNKSETVASVPVTALLQTTEGSFVYTVSGEHFVRTAVKTGEVGAEFVEITDGLYVGDQVVTKPVMTLWLTELQSIRAGKACADGD